MSFGAYVTGILFQTASFVSFMLISHGYCIMCERLSIRERRTTAVLGCLLYLSLIGYKAAVPYFTVSLLAEPEPNVKFSGKICSIFCCSIAAFCLNLCTGILDCCVF
jgi:hypothetical protein